MKLASMKTNESESVCCSSSPYGWGTQINLNEEQCKALGLTEPLRAGTKILIEAVGFVKTASESVGKEGEDKENDVSMCLQITEMSLAPAPASTKSAAEVLYEKGE